VTRIEKLTVIGVGLIGASFALALKASGQVARVVGVGRSRGNMERALALGAIDEVAVDIGAALDGADFIFIATPVGAMADVFVQIAGRLPPTAVLTDGGSAKQSVIGAARAALGPGVATFVPAHPVAGSDASGADAARQDLYQGREVVLTPLPENTPAAVARVRWAWQQCGAWVSEMQPAEHDAVLAAVSHLPHLLSYAFMHELGSRADAASTFAHAGTGFRDFTRLAASNPEMWRDICEANRAALLGEVRRFQDALAGIGALLEQGDTAALERVFTQARDVRRLLFAVPGNDG
jgi:prephenate dehydrogenase